MNYKKAYKEAIKRAKAMIEVAEKEEEVYKSAITIFPELKKSEDERIKETLIKFHKSTIDIDGIKGNEIINWLKKQGKLKWTEEDDYNVQCCIAKAEKDIRNGYPGRNQELIEWLKSLKPRMGGDDYERK